MLETGLELLADFPRIHSSCLLEPTGYAQGTREGLFSRTRKDTLYTVSFNHLQGAIHGAPIRRFRVLVFLASLGVGVQTAARAPFCPSLQESTGNQWEGVPS